MSTESNLVSTNTGSSEGSNQRNSGGSGGGRATEGRACAACKYQRRRCSPDCPLAPYFPAANHQQFLNAHKLFGLRNLCKVVKYLEQPQKDIAINTMIIQANVRASDPVGGCLRLEKELRKRIDLYRTELNLVLQQLAFCRAQALENEIQKFNTRTGTHSNTAGGDGQENANSSSLDDALNFYNLMDVQPGYDDITDRSEDVRPLLDGSSSEKMVVPKVDAETDQTHAQAENDLKNAASQFSL